MITGQVAATLGADWGTLSAQVSAWTGVAALFVAGIGGWFAFRSFKRQGRQLLELERDKRIEQASKIAAHIVSPDTTDDTKPLVVRMINASPLPIQTPIIWVIPSREKFTAGGRFIPRYLPPGDSDHTTVVKYDVSHQIGFAFPDNAGRYWFRWENIPLIEINRDGYLYLLDAIPVNDAVAFDLFRYLDDFGVRAFPPPSRGFVTKLLAVTADAIRATRG